jgi:WNK lysine deficient protein kinase
MVDRLHAEVRLLRSLHHDHIIGFHKVWLDRDNGVLNFITEVCNSGSLRDYRDRHRHVSVKALKKWARQILEGLDHLHTHEPCIIHRDLNCSNVFINGNTGQVSKLLLQPSDRFSKFSYRSMLFLSIESHCASNLALLMSTTSW